MKLFYTAVALYFMFRISIELGYIAVLAIILYMFYKSIPSLIARMAGSALLKGNTEKALRLYKTATNFSKVSGKIHLSYATLLLRTGNPEQAVTEFNLVIMKNRKKDDIKNRAKQFRSLAYFKLGNTEQALEDALELFENYKNTITYGLYCYLMLATNAPIDECYEICKEAYEYNSDDRDICDNMAAAHIKKGEFSEAKVITDEMIEKFPEFTEAYYHAAIIEKELGNKDKALELINMIDEKCKRTYLTTVSKEEIENLKNELNGVTNND